MLTIRQISDDGRWRVIQAVSVSFDPEQNEVIGHGVPGDHDVLCTSGHIYVMNENGKTVAAYNLEKKQEQNNGKI